MRTYASGGAEFEQDKRGRHARQFAVSIPAPLDVARHGAISR
jgi:hypothetical protein